MFKLIESDITKSGTALSIFNKDMSLFIKNWNNTQGLKNRFQSAFVNPNIVSRQDLTAIREYNAAITSGMNKQSAFYKYLNNSSTAVQNLAANAKYGVISTEGLTVATEKLTIAQRIGATVANALGVALRVALNVGLMLAINAIITSVTKFVNKEKELAQAASESAEKYRENINSLEELKKRYDEICDSEDTEIEKIKQLNDLKQELVDSYGFTEEALRNLNLEREKGNELLEQEIKLYNAAERGKWLGSNTEAIDNAQLAIKYNQNGINGASTDGLIQAQDFSIDGKINLENIEKDILEMFDNVEEKSDQGALFKYTEFEIAGRDMIEKYEKLQSIISAIGNQTSKTKDEERLLKILNKEAEAMEKILDIHRETYEESKEAKAANLYDEYVLANPIENVGQDSYLAWRDSLLATANGDFRIENELANILANQFPDFTKYFKNRDTAYDLFGIDDIVNDANEGMKKAFINTLSPEDLKIATQIPDLFEDGLDGAAKKIEEFNKNNPIKTDVDTLSLEELKEKYEELSKSVSDYTSNQKTLNSALEEQKEHGQLSASTIQSLTEAGYAQALVTDKVTGAVTLNMQAYEQLNLQKKESIRLEAEQNKSALQDKFKEEQIALNDLAEEMKTANAERRKAIALEMAQHSNNMAEYYDEIAKFDGMLSSLDAPTFDNSDNGNSDNKEPIAVTDFKKTLAEKEHLLAMEQITEEEFYTWLDSESERVYGNLADYQDELWKHEEEIYKWRKDKRQEEIDSEKEYIESLKDEYSEMIDSRIDEQEKLAESIEKSYDDKISAIDKEIDAINKASEAEERHKDILDAEKSVMEAQKKLQEASIKNRLTYVGNGAWEARQDTDAIEEAKSELEDAKNERDKAYQENHISALEEQKELLETQKDNASKYYDNIVKNLEQQKTDREKTYDTFIDIYDEISVEKKQTTSNTDLVKKLTDGGDISKAVQNLTPTELTNAVKSGILTTDSNGNYTVDYSVLDNNTSSVVENTTALNNINDTLNKFVPETVANDSIIVGNTNVNPTTYSEWAKKHTTDEWKPDGKNVPKTTMEQYYQKEKGSFGGYGSINNLVKAIQSDEFKYSSTVASQMFNNNVQSRIGQGLAKMPEYVNNVFNNDLKPEFNCTFNIEGSMDRKTMVEVEHRLDSKFIEYTQKLTNAVTTSYNKQMSKI